jgi:hypothetical protein
VLKPRWLLVGLQGAQTLRLRLSALDLAYPLAVAVGTRAGLYLLVVLFVGLFPGGEAGKPDFWQAVSRWDGQWYLSIAEKGYSWQGPAVQSNVVFWPLYPLLAKVVGGLLGDLRWGFLVTTNVAYAAFLVCLFRLTTLDFDRETAKRAVVYAAIFPGAFVLGAFYTEALSFALVVAAFYAGRRGRWGWAIALGFLAGLTRLPANVVLIALAYEYWRQRGLRLQGLWLAAIPVGALSFVAFIAVLTGEPLAVLTAQYTAWFRTSVTPFQTVSAAMERTGWPLAQYVTSVGLLDAGAILLFGALTLWAVVRFPASYWLFALPVLMGSLSVGMDPAMAPPTASVTRFLMAIFPGYIGLAQWGRNEWVNQVMTWTFAFLMGVFAIHFFSGFWVL